METRFKVTTDISKLEFRTVDLVDPTLFNVTSAAPLFQGEWLKWDGAGLDRAAAHILLNDMCFPLIDQEYEYGARALGSVSTIWSSTFEFLTQLYDTANAPATIGAPCYVGEIIFPVGGAIPRMIIEDGTTGGGAGVQKIIARVTAVAANGFIKAIRIWT